MNANNAAQFLPLVQALAQGKTIQCDYGSEGWKDTKCPQFDGADRFRIKPEPREWTLLVPTAANTYNDLPHICRTTTAQSDKHWEKITVREIL